MAGKRVAQKAVDWAKISAVIPKTASAEFNSFRVRHEEIRQRLNSFSEKPQPIDWSFYQANVKNQALVKKFQDLHSKVSIPRPEDTKSAEIDASQKDFDVQVAKAEKESAATIAELQAKVAVINSMKPFEEMTMDEYLATKPELVKEVDKEMKEHGWA